jgi:hypothetical protein
MYARRTQRILRRSSIPSNAGPGSLQPIDLHVVLAKHSTPGNKNSCDRMGSVRSDRAYIESEIEALVAQLPSVKSNL